jgi:hypothetical protein
MEKGSERIVCKLESEKSKSVDSHQMASAIIRGKTVAGNFKLFWLFFSISADGKTVEISLISTTQLLLSNYCGSPSFH